ncbi:MAG: hypothetical protein ABR583_08710 [Gaiellaceae bacterium]
MSVPAVVITLPLEGRPSIEIHAEREGDEARLAEWIGSHDPLVELYLHAFAVADEMRRAA